MLKNIPLEFNDLYNMTCAYYGVEDKLPVWIKTTPGFVQKKNKLKNYVCV